MRDSGPMVEGTVVVSGGAELRSLGDSNELLRGFEVTTERHRASGFHQVGSRSAFGWSNEVDSPHLIVGAPSSQLRRYIKAFSTAAFAPGALAVGSGATCLDAPTAGVAPRAIEAPPKSAAPRRKCLRKKS